MIGLEFVHSFGQSSGQLLLGQYLFHRFLWCWCSTLRSHCVRPCSRLFAATTGMRRVRASSLWDPRLAAELGRRARESCDADRCIWNWVTRDRFECAQWARFVFRCNARTPSARCSQLPCDDVFSTKIDFVAFWHFRDSVSVLLTSLQLVKLMSGSQTKMRSLPGLVHTTARLNKARCNIAATSSGELVFFEGGLNTTGPSDRLDSYNATSNT